MMWLFIGAGNEMQVMRSGLYDENCDLYEMCESYDVYGR